MLAAHICSIEINRFLSHLASSCLCFLVICIPAPLYEAPLIASNQPSYTYQPCWPAACSSNTKGAADSAPVPKYLPFVHFLEQHLTSARRREFCTTTAHKRVLSQTKKARGRYCCRFRMARWSRSGTGFGADDGASEKGSPTFSPLVDPVQSH